MIIVHKNKSFFSKLENLDKASYHYLRGLLSYEDNKQLIARAMFRKRVKRFSKFPPHLKWNGTVYLLEENGKYPTGLTDKILAFLDEETIPYQLSNNQISNFKKEILPIKGIINLREHQKDALKAVIEHKWGMVNACTSFGKTKTSIKMCEEIGAYPFLFIVHRLSLLKQTYREYEQYFDIPIGWIGDGKIDVQKINIASIATICSALGIKYKAEDDEKTKYTAEQLNQVKQLLKDCKFLVHDELHHGAASTSQTILKQIENADYKIGLSATPFRTDGADLLLEASFGPIIYKKTASELINEGFLTPPKIFFCTYTDDENEAKYPRTAKKSVFSKVYKECIVDNEEYHMLVTNLAINSADMKRSTLISVKQIDHGKNILAAFKKYTHNHEVYFLSGKDKPEYIDEMLAKFQAKEYFILVSTLIDEGVDIPAIDTVINAGGGASAIKAIQLTGRALRQYPGKKFAYIYDFVHPYSFLYNHSKERAKILSQESAFQIKTFKYE